MISTDYSLRRNSRTAGSTLAGAHALVNTRVILAINSIRIGPAICIVTGASNSST